MTTKTCRRIVRTCDERRSAPNSGNDSPTLVIADLMVMNKPVAIYVFIGGFEMDRPPNYCARFCIHSHLGLPVFSRSHKSPSWVPFPPARWECSLDLETNPDLTESNPRRCMNLNCVSTARYSSCVHIKNNRHTGK